MNVIDLEQFARQRLDINRQRLALKEQQEQRLTVAYNGGLFCIDVALMAFLASWDNAFDLYLTDSYGNPIYIDSAEALLERCRVRWSEVMNDWHNQHQELKKVRRINQLDEQ